MSSIVNENGPLAMTQERAPEIWQAVPHGFHLYAFSLRCFMIGMSFFNNVDVARIDRSEAEGFSLQAVLKVLLILAASALGGWGWWKSPELRKLLLTLPGALFMLLGVWYFVSVPWSLDPKVSLTAAVLYWGGFIFCLACIRYVGGTKVMLDICLGQFCFCFSRWCFTSSIENWPCSQRSFHRQRR